MATNLGGQKFSTQFWASCFVINQTALQNCKNVARFQASGAVYLRFSFIRNIARLWLVVVYGRVATIYRSRLQVPSSFLGLLNHWCWTDVPKRRQPTTGLRWETSQNSEDYRNAYCQVRPTSRLVRRMKFTTFILIQSSILLDDYYLVLMPKYLCHLQLQFFI
jgi:hypothetical protein